MIMDQNRHERMGRDPGSAQGRQGQAQEMAIVRTWDFIPNTIELVAGFKEKENRNSCKSITLSVV